MKSPATLADQIEQHVGALTAVELAGILNIHRVTILKMAAKHRIPSFRIGSAVRFCPVTVATWLRTM